MVSRCHRSKDTWCIDLVDAEVISHGSGGMEVENRHAM